MIRKPLVLVNGQLQQLQAGDFVASYDIATFTNNEASSLVIGTPVYNDVADGVKKADADSGTTKKVIGLVFDTSALSGAPVNVLLSGKLTATTGQWDAIFGTTGGLAVGTSYYLSDATAGTASSTAPSAGGSYVVEVGVAASPTELILASPFRSILL